MFKYSDTPGATTTSIFISGFMYLIDDAHFPAVGTLYDLRVTTVYEYFLSTPVEYSYKIDGRIFDENHNMSIPAFPYVLRKGVYRPPRLKITELVIGANNFYARFTIPDGSAQDPPIRGVYYIADLNSALYDYNYIPPSEAITANSNIYSTPEIAYGAGKDFVSAANIIANLVLALKSDSCTPVYVPNIQYPPEYTAQEAMRIACWGASRYGMFAHVLSTTILDILDPPTISSIELYPFSLRINYSRPSYTTGILKNIINPPASAGGNSGEIYISFNNGTSFTIRQPKGQYVDAPYPSGYTVHPDFVALTVVIGYYQETQQNDTGKAFLKSRRCSNIIDMR
jgi:hypothetical protein